MPSLVYGLLEVRKVDRQKVRDGMLAAAAIGYLCKHHATLSAAEGGSGRDRRGVVDGCGLDRDRVRRVIAGRRTRPNRPSSITWA